MATAPLLEFPIQEENFAPPVPGTIEDTGLPASMIEQLVLQAWCQENGLHIKAVHWSWRWEGGPFHRNWTGHSPLQRDWRGNIYRFEAVRDGETATQVYWAIITLWRGQMEVAVETPAHSYVPVGTSHFPRAVF